MSLAGSLTRGRARAASIMTDTCQVTRITGQTVGSDGLVTYTTAVVYGPGQCRMQLRGQTSHTAETVDQPGAVVSAELQLPAGTPSLATGDVATITASGFNAALVGSEWRVTNAANRKSQETAYRIVVESLS